MLTYPVDVTQQPDGRFAARLADLPDGPVGLGGDPASAYMDLAGKAVDALTPLMLTDTHPAPSPAGDRPVVMLDAPEPMRPVADNLQQGVAAEKTIGYGWTNQTTFRDH